MNYTEARKRAKAKKLAKMKAEQAPSKEAVDAEVEKELEAAKPAPEAPKPAAETAETPKPKTTKKKASKKKKTKKAS